uniref:Uncharacterized protein n=1 Tax=Timema bartmani TaxID=61472 RepID=A0A7R9F442_9NEOP|nr:unnamed protein product [Timema bartmani]
MGGRGVPDSAGSSSFVVPGRTSPHKRRWRWRSPPIRVVEVVEAAMEVVVVVITEAETTVDIVEEAMAAITDVNEQRERAEYFSS